MRRLLALALAFLPPAQGWAAAALGKTQAPVVARLGALPTLSLAGPVQPQPGYGVLAGPLKLGVAPSVNNVPKPQDFEAPVARTVLENAALSPQAAALAFDGKSGGGGGVSPDMGGAVPGKESAGPPPLEKHDPSKYPKKPKSLYRSYAAGLGLSVAAMVAAPIAWKAAPMHEGLFMLATTMLVPAAVSAAYHAVKLVRRLLRSPPSPPRTKKALRRAFWAGAAAGVLLNIGAHSMQATIVEMLPRAARSVKAYEKFTDIDHVRGDTLKLELIKAMQGNPAGEDVLDELRDRGGVIRFPDFYVSRMAPTTMASYVSPVDGIFINELQLERHGVMREDFLNDPEVQKAFAAQFLVTFVHELRHAAQFRRGWEFPGHVPGYTGKFKGWHQVEYEANLTEHFFVFHRMKAGQPITKIEELLGPLESLEEYFADIDANYPDNIHSEAPYWEKQLARYTDDWDAHVKETYLLLAKYYEKTDPARSKLYQEKAGKPEAKDVGLMAKDR